MTKFTSALVFAAALSAPIWAQAESVTYDYTGSLAGSSDAVSGTITIDPSSPPTVSIGTIGSSQWDTQTYGGSGYGHTPLPTSLPVSATVSIDGGPTFAFDVPTMVDGSLGILAGVPNGSGGAQYEASMDGYTADGYNAFYLLLTATSGQPWTSDGQPVFDMANENDLSIYETSPAGVVVDSVFTLTSLKAATAPEIDPASAASALTLLVGGLAALRGRRSGLQSSRAKTV